MDFRSQTALWKHERRGDKEKILSPKLVYCSFFVFADYPLVKNCYSTTFYEVLNGFFVNYVISFFIIGGILDIPCI